MPPDLVIADAPFKSYPGGIIALKCDEWMAGARGSLTSGSDALACTGTRVRDTQTVTTSILDDVFTAYTEADDTLEVPFSAIPIEVGMGYTVMVSYRVPGDWDVTNPDTIKSSTSLRFAGVVAMGFHGIAGSAPNENDPMIDFESPTFGALARIPYYVTAGCGTTLGIFDAQTTDTLFVRAFAQDGTTAEWLLDQIILFPNLSSYIGPPINGWDTQDFATPSPFTPSTDTLPIEDGTDGGDANGKFTWCPFPPTDRMEQLLGGGGGDYQQKADSSTAEYFMRRDEADHDAILQTPSGAEAPAHAYSCHCARWPGEASEVVNDTFSRTITVAAGSDKWGQTTEGYQWVTGAPKSGVDGSVGIMEFAPSISSGGSALGYFADGPPTLNDAARLDLWDQVSFSGKFSLGVHPAGWDADPGPISDVRAIASIDLSSVNGNSYSIRVNLADTGGQFFHWNFGYSDAAAPGFHSLTGDVDISSWYSDGSEVGFRIEVKRYLLRMRVWDASGAEPGTWDYEDFRPINATGAAALEQYPYSDDPYQAIFAYASPFTFGVGGEFSLISATVQLWWDDIVVERDPYGDFADVGTSIEQPDGSEISSITIPYGAAYAVYWGLRDWTAPDGGDFWTAFSNRVWNEPGAAELQRAESAFFFFRTVHGGLISMNWRSADREGSHQRVLVGPS